MQLTEKQKELKQDFIDNRGYWTSELEHLLVLDKEFFDVYSKFTTLPWKTGVLAPKVKELILVAINSSPTHLYETGLRTHVVNALELGATKEEIMEVFQLTSALGMHTQALGVPILMEESEHQQDSMSGLTKKQSKLKNSFIEQMGYWSEFREDLVSLDEEYFEGYLDLLSFPWKQGVLDSKVKELIYIAVDSSTTHLYEVGLRAHIKKALNFGATIEEVLEVFELTSTLGFQAVEKGAAILSEELEQRHTSTN